MAPLLGKVLVTGGGGFLGSHIVEAFVAEPECAQVVATYRQQRPNQHTDPETTYYVCNLSDREQVAALLHHTNPDIIIHTVMPGAFALPDVSYRINYLLTKHLLELAKQHLTVRGFIYTSSTEAVGLASGFNSKPENEEEAVLCTLKLGSNPYARIKGAADALVLVTNT